MLADAHDGIVNARQLCTSVLDANLGKDLSQIQDAGLVPADPARAFPDAYLHQWSDRFRIMEWKHRLE